MKKVIIFGGTTEGRQLANALAAAHIPCIYSVATEYGKQPVEDSDYVEVVCGRMDSEAMYDFFMQRDPAAIVDATHPFAEIVKQEIDNAVFKYIDVPFYRVSREESEVDYSNCHFFDSAEECAKALADTKGNIFLTTGSKELKIFCANEQLRERITARVIPSEESLAICRDNGLKGSQIIAMQGPFSAGMNLAFLREMDARILVLKESGSTSGEAERIIAANKANVSCYIIRRPKSPSQGMTLIQVRERLYELFDVDKSSLLSEVDDGSRFIVTLAGFGMGFGSITSEVEQAILEADYIFGAPRMIVGIDTDSKKFPLYKADDIMDKLEELAQEKSLVTRKALVLFSGDTGFYSGAKKLIAALKTSINYQVRVLPGISTVSAFAAVIEESWQDSVLMSSHGIKEEVWLPKLIAAVSHNEKTYVLTSGSKDVRLIGDTLKELEISGQGKYQAIAGMNLYSQEKIIRLTMERCCNFNEDGLCILFIRNKSVIPKRLTPGLSDEAFIRDRVPMSKEEIRALSLCKLGVTSDAICYDIGSGSGSVATEMGLLDPTVRVYAIELKPDACALTLKNTDKFHLKNVTLIEGTAPEAMESLPTPTHVFIGGSGGRLDEIIAKLISYKSDIRVVVNAVTIETIAEINTVLKKYQITDVDMIQVAVSKAKRAGDYNVMQGHNPVYIVTFNITGE
ncbi:MAG: precorrin-6A reductase [Pseudobutyrivibrio sp.]|nr:precorrin-6A reductase [Pseudobutyrivibrio sp.]